MTIINQKPWLLIPAARPRPILLLLLQQQPLLAFGDGLLRCYLLSQLLVQNPKLKPAHKRKRLTARSIPSCSFHLSKNLATEAGRLPCCLLVASVSSLLLFKQVSPFHSSPHNHRIIRSKSRLLMSVASSVVEPEKGRLYLV